MDIVKKDGTRQQFDKDKIANGCMKAGASEEVAKKVADAVSLKVRNGTTTRKIGEMVIARLGKFNRKAASEFEKQFLKKHVSVVKKDGSKQPFEKGKIMKGCMKAGASEEVAKKVADAVGRKVKDGMKTGRIGELVIASLKGLNKRAAAAFEQRFRSKKR